MKIIKTFAIAAGLAALAACGGTEEAAVENTDANMMADNLTVDANSVTVINEGMPMDLNATTDMNMVDMNATTDANMMTNNTM